MPLSEDLVLMEAFVSVVASGDHALTREGAAELRLLLARAAEEAVRLEDDLDRALADCDRHAPATIPAAVLAKAIRAGKVELLAAHRVRRLPDLAQPGWTA